MISCRDWWPWTKCGYITMNRRQNNNQWSDNIAVHPAPKKFRVQNALENFLPRFFWIKTASSSLVISQGVKLSTPSITHLCWWNWKTFWRKNASGRSLRGSCSCTTMHGSPGTCNPEETDLPGIPVSWSSTIFSDPVWHYVCSLNWKNNFKVATFSYAQFMAAAENFLDGQSSELFFLSGLQKLE